MSRTLLCSDWRTAPNTARVLIVCITLLYFIFDPYHNFIRPECQEFFKAPKTKIFFSFQDIGGIGYPFVFFIGIGRNFCKSSLDTFSLRTSISNYPHLSFTGKCNTKFFSQYILGLLYELDILVFGAQKSPTRITLFL